MTRPARRLRTRLLVAMISIALGVLVLTAAVTAGLARRTEVDAARHDVQDRAAVVAPEFDRLIEQLPSARAAKQTKSAFVRDAVIERIAEAEDYRLAVKRLAAIKAGKEKTVPFDVIKRALGH